MKILVIGAGHIGLTPAACPAEIGLQFGTPERAASGAEAISICAL